VRSCSILRDDVVGSVRALKASPGKTIFGGGALPPMRLLDVRRRDGSDNVLLRYGF
jgi:hypothetical protein